MTRFAGTLLLMSVLVLTPGQSRQALGAELTALGVVLATAVMISAVRAHFPVTKWRWTNPIMPPGCHAHSGRPTSGITRVPDPLGRRRYMPCHSSNHGS